MKKWLRRCKKAIISTEYTLKVYYMHFNIVFVDKKNNLCWDWRFLKSYFKKQDIELNNYYELTNRTVPMGDTYCYDCKNWWKRRCMKCDGHNNFEYYPRKRSMGDT